MDRLQPCTGRTGQVMKGDRRDFMMGAALAVTLATSPIPLAQAAVRRVLVIGSGLGIDRPFASGAAAEITPVKPSSPDFHAALVEQLRAGRGQLVLALVEPRLALLLEEAAMDCRLGIKQRQAVQAPLHEDQRAWAFRLGHTLASGLPLISATNSENRHGARLVALALR